MDERAKINLNHGDCMEAMASMKDNAYDLAIVDPPYGINQGGKNNRTRGKLAPATEYVCYDDSKPMPKKYFDELFRVSKHQIIWGANHFIENMPRNSSCWLVWDKVNGNSDFADCELAWTSFDKAVRQYRFMWHGMMQGKTSDGAVFEGNLKLHEKRIHINQKPVQLYKWCLMTFAMHGWIILDTHSGSGSLEIACWDLGFNCDAFEKIKEIHQAGKDRFENHISQGQFDFN